MDEEKPIIHKLLVVSAHPFMREGIINVLSGEDGIEVVGQASNMLELLESINKLSPDIVIINDELNKNVNSLEAIRLINREAPATKILLVIEDYNEPKELTALEVGVTGLLLEGARKADFIKCIRVISKGELWVRREIMSRFIKQLSQAISKTEIHPASLVPTSSFTKRELDILMLVNKGHRNKDIAKRLFISEKTVKYYLSKIFRKLKIKKRGDIPKYFFLLIGSFSLLQDYLISILQFLDFC